MLLHVRTIDKPRILGYYGRVTDEVMAYVDDALRIATGLIEI
jgi:mRNA-degrading endonuclease toxin of MazEF toxin-antitoxin module